MNVCYALWIQPVDATDRNRPISADADRMNPQSKAAIHQLRFKLAINNPKAILIFTTFLP